MEIAIPAPLRPSPKAIVSKTARSKTACLALLPLTFWACSPAETPAPSAAPADVDAGLHFVDVASDVGLDAFRQVSGEADKMALPASTGAGVALFDADGDGDLDVFFVNGSRLAGYPPGEGPTQQLFLNEGDGNSFRDVTAGSGLESHNTWGQGVAVADVDGDDDLDLYVTRYGSANALYLNRGVDGEGQPIFEDVAAQAGIEGGGWSTGAAFLDYDRDGDLDLYVARFVNGEEVLAGRGIDWPEHDWKGLTVAAGPMGLPATSDLLYRNDGELSFTDVSSESGVSRVEPAYGFQPTLGDYDGDGWIDIFVANDSVPNFLWRNLEGHGFRESALSTGVASDRAGVDQACMGAAFDDHDGDGWLDIFVTNFADELNTLYVGDGHGFFYDGTAAAGLAGQKSRQSLAWGTFFFDAENDGDLDLFIANGHIYPQVAQLDSAETYAQSNQLMEKAMGRFRDVSEDAGPGLAIRKVSRGAAIGDLDDDGDLEIVINNFDDVPTVLRNESASPGHWLKVRLVGRAHNRSAIGARVRLTAGGNSHSRIVRSSESYLSHHDLRLHFGLGPAVTIDSLRVDWPDGTAETFDVDGVDTLLTLEQGSGVSTP